MYKRIRELREDSDLKQSDIAKIMNTTQQHYSKIENGKAEPKADQIIKIALFYQTTTDYILGLTNISTPYKRSNKNEKN